MHCRPPAQAGAGGGAAAGDGGVAGRAQGGEAVEVRHQVRSRVTYPGDGTRDTCTGEYNEDTCVYVPRQVGSAGRRGPQQTVRQPSTGQNTTVDR